MYGERGRGGGADRETGTARIKREIERRRYDRHSLVRIMPAHETMDSRPSWEAPSPSPPHPHPSQVPPAAQVGGGCKPEYGMLGRENRRGHWSTEARGLVAFRRTDDGGQAMGGSAEYTETGGEEADRTKRERRRARCLYIKEPGILGGGKRKGPNHHRRET